MKNQNQFHSYFRHALNRSAVCLLWIVLSATKLSAQDKITLLNGEELNGRITEVTDSEIKYVSSENPSGPIRVLYKKDVFLIRYENGTRELVSGAAVQPAPVSTQGINSKEKDTSFVAARRKKFGGPRFGITYLSPGTT